MQAGLTGWFRVPEPRARLGLLSHVAAWLVPAAAAAIYAFHQGLIVGGDSHFFEYTGGILLSSHWSDAFSQPAVQAGPLQLALFGSLAGSNEALALVLLTGTIVLFLAAVRAAAVRHPVLLGGAGLVAIWVSLPGTAYSTGHPADAVLPLIWILAAADARRGHARRAGLLVGLTAGLETWGILGVAVLALAPRKREACAGAALAAATALALFLPFVLGGHFAMWSFQWQVRPPSLLSFLVPGGTPFGWPLRLAQGLFAASAGVAVAWLLRNSVHALWAAPLAIVVARLALDPLLLSYYRAALWGPVIVGAALCASRVSLQRQLRRETYPQTVNPPA